MATNGDTGAGEDDKNWWESAIDSVENTVSDIADSVADVVEDVPVIGSIAEAVDQTTQVVGGIAKGAGDMVDGVVNMVEHPVDTFMGLEGMAEHIPFVGNGLKAVHDGIDAAVDGKDVWGAVEQDLDLSQSLSDDGAYWEKVGGAIIDPYKQEIEEGKGAEAFGRGAFDIGGIILSAGAGAAAEGAVDAGRVAGVAAEGAEAVEAAGAVRVGEVSAEAGDMAEGATTGTRASGSEDFRGYDADVEDNVFTTSGSSHSTEYGEPHQDNIIENHHPPQEGDIFDEFADFYPPNDSGIDLGDNSDLDVHDILDAYESPQ
jgi:hypothetical protein